MCHLRESLMGGLVVRLLVAALTFIVGLAAGALWGATQTSEAPTAERTTAVLVGEPTVLVGETNGDGRAGDSGAQIVSGGVLDGRVISKPAPEYPAAGESARAQGIVVVSVRVDEDGRVEAAWAVSGHPLLQAAAVEAARGARFAPTRLSGRPVKVVGTLTYNVARG